MTGLRGYQQQAIQALRHSVATGHKAPLLVAPCGAGKTAIAAEMIFSAREKARPCLFLAPRRELIYQTARRLESVGYGIDYGIIMAGEDPSLTPGVQVASIPTLHARAIQRDAIDLPPAGLVLVDEAHIGIGGRSQEIIEHYQRQAVVVGLTATPARTDGRGLGMVYDDLVLGPSVADLTEAGYLVPSRYFAGEKPDTSGIPVQAGDYQQTELGKRANETELVGDVVANWFRLASDRQTFVFAVNRAHSRHLAQRFAEHGIAAEHIDGATDLDTRRAIHDRLQRGETQVVCNCQVYTYGVDFPPVSCIVLACPTKSLTKYHQMVGRGLRPSPGKSDCFVLDHAGIVLDEKLGFIDDTMPWSLDGRSKVQRRKADSERRQPDNMQCPECESVIRPAPQCPVCCHEMGQRYARAIKAHQAELAEIDKRDRQRRRREWTLADKARFYAELKGYRERYRPDYKLGWPAAKYRERLGVWPRGHEIRNMPACEPSQETLAWIRSRNIARAKAREKAARP